MTATTIKLDSAVRDRLNAAARERGVTAGSFVDQLLEAWLREQRFRAVRQALAGTDAAVRRTYDDEVAAFDGTLLDGLGPSDAGSLRG